MNALASELNCFSSFFRYSGMILRATFISILVYIDFASVTYKQVYIDREVQLFDEL